MSQPLSTPVYQVVARPHGRLYVTHAWRNGSVAEPFDTSVWGTEQRIRQFAVQEFTRLFEGAPSFVWAQDGHAAECWDDAGNRLRVQQINDR